MGRAPRSMRLASCRGPSAGSLSRPSPGPAPCAKNTCFSHSNSAPRRGPKNKRLQPPFLEGVCHTSTWPENCRGLGEDGPLRYPAREQRRKDTQPRGTGSRQRLHPGAGTAGPRCRQEEDVAKRTHREGRATSETLRGRLAPDPEPRVGDRDEAPLTLLG